MSTLRTMVYFVLFSVIAPGVPEALCQGTTSPRIDLSVTYVGQHTLRANTQQSFWLQGGAVELGVNLWRGVGIAAELTGLHAASIGSSGVPVSLIITAAGPRYRWAKNHRISPYGEFLAGGVYGFNGVYPTATGSQGIASSLALQLGGGVDVRLTKHLSVRALEASWVRTELPNGTDGIQNYVRLGTGLMLRFPH